MEYNDETFAVKVYNHKIDEEEFKMQIADRKIKTLQGAGHPFIAKFVKEFINSSDQYCIINEFISDFNLGDIISSKQSPSEEEVMIYFLMLLLTFHWLHS